MLLLLLVCTVANAQPESGKVYRFVNKANSGHSLAAVSTTRSSISATADRYPQYWLLETHPSNSSAWTLRNLGNGRYLQHAGTSSHWSFVDAASNATALYYVTVTDTTGTYCTFNSANNTSGWACMHYGSGGIVGWESAADATKWTMTEVSVTSDELAANWEALTEFNNASDDNALKDYKSALDALFADDACTTLESTYASMLETDLQNDANYKALPAALQELVLKVRNGDWQEVNYVSEKEDWESEQAKKFRVQLYEPHSIAGDITSWLRINAHNNMDNPTGIFANYRDVIYVMVEGEIKTGASLYLYALNGHGQMGSYNDGNAVQLQEGLNIVPFIGDGNALWINYMVDTYNADGTTDAERFPYKLSDYEPLKINIAGGSINGYYNAVGDDLWGAPDDDNDWAYYKDRASLESFTLLSHRVTMQFYMYETVGEKGLSELLDEITVPDNPYSFSGTKGTAATFDQYEGMGLDASTGKINIMLEAWNRITYSELATLGVLDAATIDKMNEKYPRWYNNWTERGNIYDYNAGNDGKTYLEYCQGIDYSEYFNHHCLAISNTSGYMSGGWQSSNYHINTAGSIIGKIAAEAGPTWGPAHEIGHQHQSLFTLNGLTEVTNNLYSNIAVWYMGMGTSRVNGTSGSLASVLEAFNTEGSDYYTNNIWALTQMYYRLWLYYHLAGNNTQFYPRLMELLRREPLENGGSIGPGGLLRFYKHCCVAAGEDLTEFFRAHGMLSVMTDRFVGDYANATYNQSQEQIDEAIAEVKALGLPVNIAPLFISDATPDATYGHDGTTQRSYWDGESTTSGNNAEVGSYVDYVNGDEADVSSVYSLTGTTMSIDNLSGVGIAIFNEEGEIIAFSTKSTFEITEECAALIASGEAELKVVNADNTTTELPSVMDTDDTAAKYAALGELLEEVNAIVSVPDATGTKVGYYRADAIGDLTTAYNAAKTVYDEQTTASYALAYESLSQAYADVLNDGYARIGIVEGNTYRLENKAYPTLSMSITTDNVMLGETTDADSEAQQWYLESSDTEGSYYLKNKSTSTYPGSAGLGAVLSATATSTTDAQAYKLVFENGYWALGGGQYLHCSASQRNNIVGWYADADASQWTITAVTVDATAESRYKLEDLVQKTETLMGKMADVSLTEKLKLQTTSSSEAFYLSTNACYNTLNNAADGEGLEGLLDESTSTYFHSDWGGKVTETHYLQVDLGDGYELSNFMFNYATRDNGNNCPTAIVVAGCDSEDGTFTTLDTFTAADDGLPNGSGLTWKSPEISNPNNYRYLRFSVTATENSKVYFVMSTFGITNSLIRVKEIGSEYAAVGLTEELLLTSAERLLAADELAASSEATGDELDEMYSSLAGYYTQLTTYYEAAETAAIDAKKTELETLITNTNTLISGCGSVTYTPGTFSGTPQLQTDDDSADFYVWTNAQEADEGPIADLVDGDNYTFFHSDYSGANSTDGLDHHITINLGEGNEVSSFTFGYVTRHNADANYPETIEVYGSENGTDYESLTTISGLPSGNTKTYTREEAIVSSKSYSNLRFMVTATNNNNYKGGHPIFHMAEFSLNIIGTPESYEVEFGADSGGATKELMIAAYAEVASAQISYTSATTEAQLQAAIDRLQADYDALYDAKISTTYVTYNVQVVGGDGTGGVEYKGTSYKHNATFEAPQNLSVANLAAITISGYSEGVVTLSGTTITVTYQKIYTVQVTGGDGTGALIYNSTEYTADATITTSQNIDENALTAKSIDGYDAAITVDHTAGTITVRYTMTPLVDTTKYYTFECCSGESHNTTRFISDNGSVIDGRSAEATRFSFEAADDANGYYIRSVVSGRYLNHKDGGIYASEEKNTVWTIAKTTFSTLGNPYTLTVGDNLYLNNHQTTDCTDGSCTNLRSNLHSSGVGSGNACSLWTLVAYDEAYDKSEMATLLTNTNALVASCYTDGVFNYTGSLYVTEELVTTTESAVTDAQEVYNDNTALYAVYVVAKTNLQTAYDNLQNAIDHAWLPVLLTTDHKEPVLYTIKSKRGDATVVQYDPADNHMFSIAAASTGSAKQAFYFMAGEKDQVYVCPFAAGEQVLSADEVANAAGKVFAKKQGNATYQQWTFVKRTVDGATWYNLQPVDASSYLSNIFGGANKLGFYSSAPESDLGSLFQFESTTVDGSAAYNSLKVYFEEGVKVASSSIVGGDEVGYYPEDAANVYNTAYADTKSLLDTEATYDEYLTAYYTLLAANEALVLNMPEEGKFYTIVSAHTGYASNKLMYATTDNKFRWDGDKTDKNPEAVWVYTEKGYLKNLQTGCFLNNATTWGGQYTLGDNDAKEVSIKSISLDGQLLLTPAGGSPLHADQVGTVVGWHAYDAGSASAWRIVEVEDMSQVNFTLKIGQYRHAGLYLDYATEIPEGLDVFVVHSPDGEEGSILADQIEGSILPARTAVIVKGDEGEYDFTYTTSENTTDTDKFDANLLGGSAYLKYQQRTDADHLCCVFGRKGNEVGLYKNYVEYVDANGTQTVTEKDTDGNESVKSYADTDDGTHFKVSANKIYFEYKASAVANASAFRFRFRSNEEEGTTMIDELLLTGDAVIYNLYGQRVTKVVEPGTYIINGKKAFVSEKMILNND